MSTTIKKRSNPVESVFQTILGIFVLIGLIFVAGALSYAAWWVFVEGWNIWD